MRTFLFTTSLSITSLLIPLMATPAAMASGEICEGWRVGPMTDQPQGVNGYIEDAYPWDPPTGGSLLVVGGNFTTAGGVTVNSIAAWDGATWRALGGGVQGVVYCLSVYNGDLVAGGIFTSAGGVPVSNVARFNGTTWSALGGGIGNGQVNCLRVYNGQLYAGGTFTFNTGSGIARDIARFNGTSWITVSSGITAPFNDTVRTMNEWNGNLIVGGFFNNAGGTTVSNLAQWNGTSWSALAGGGANNFVNAIQPFNGELAIAGEFTTIGGVSANRIARWTGSGFAAYGGGLNNAVYSMYVYNSRLYAGGLFTNVGVGLNVGDRLAVWTGSAWSNVLRGVWGGASPQVSALMVFGSRLYVGGLFTTVGDAGGIAATNFAYWDDFILWQVDSPPATVAAMTTFGNRIVAAGSFAVSTNLVPAYNLVAWDGAKFTNLSAFSGSGLNSSAECLVSYTVSGPAGGKRLVIGGSFTQAGGIAANRIAQYNEGDVALPSWSALGSGFGSAVHAVERFNNVTFAGGEFNAVSQFTGGAWSSIGNTNGPVYALKTYNGQLYAGGAFTTIAGVSTGALARWNGTTWTSVGGFFGGQVNALEIHNGELVIGGNFPGISGAHNIAKYNSVNGLYSNLSTGGTDNTVISIKSENGFVYIGGYFSMAGGAPATRLARWSAGTGWQAIPGGANDIVRAISAFNNDVQVGGNFTAVASGGLTSPGWARYSEAGVPWVALQPASQTINCGQNVTFAASLAPGYFAGFQWRKNGNVIANGATGHGSLVNGALSPSLTITGAVGSDAGAYDCIVSNTCGSSTSAAATLTLNFCCQPDVNHSGGVNVDDLLIVINAWGFCQSPCPPSCAADIAPLGTPGGNCVVNVDDLLAVVNAWGPCP